MRTFVFLCNFDVTGNQTRPSMRSLIGNDGLFTSVSWWTHILLVLKQLSENNFWTTWQSLSVSYMYMICCHEPWPGQLAGGRRVPWRVKTSATGGHMVGAVRNSNRLGHSLPCVCLGEPILCWADARSSRPACWRWPATCHGPPLRRICFFFGSITDKFVSKAKTDKFVLELLLYYYCNTMQ